MIRKVLVLFIPTLLLTGCSSAEPERKLEYDPIEIIEYQNCLNNPPEYLGGLFNPPRDWAEEACADKKPIPK